MGPKSNEFAFFDSSTRRSEPPGIRAAIFESLSVSSKADQVHVAGKSHFKIGASGR